MQPYNQQDPYEGEPLDSSYQQHYDPSYQPPVPPSHGRYQPADEFYEASPPPRPQQSYSQRFRGQNQAYDRVPAHAPQGRAPPNYGGPLPPRHTEDTYYHGAGQSRPRGGDTGYAHMSASSTVTPGADNFSEAAYGGMAGIAYSVAERNARESGLEAMRGTGQLPPPLSHGQYSDHSQQNLSPQRSARAHGYDNRYGVAAGPSGPSHSPPRSMHSVPSDPFQSYPVTRRDIDANFGMLDPNDIEDDGDDGLYYAKNSQRNSMMSASNSDRGARPAIGAAAAVGGATAAGGAIGKVLGRDGHIEHYAPGAPEKSTGWWSKQQGKGKRWKWIVIALIFLVVCGAVIGGIVGGLVSNSKNDNSGNSAAEDEKENGDLSINSSEIKNLLNNADLHKVFPGMDYTPYNTQYPACLGNPPSQNNVTRDIAVLSQLTNRVRLYGTDCNQTEMVLHALDRLEMTSDIKVWLGVWLDNNQTTNNRQLDQMYNILDKYGQDPFEGIIVGNEVLFREDLTITQLSDILTDVRSKLTEKSISLKVGTSDLGDDWTAALSQASDYVMANIHPFFSGITAPGAAAWTWNFWQTNDRQFWKSEASQNIISETGWPSAGGKDCGAAKTCVQGSVAGIDEMNQYMEDWVCQALNNGTLYFWFEAFDEPWKVIYNTPGEDWEDKWGLMDAGRNLKNGVKIPDCGGKTVS